MFLISSTGDSCTYSWPYINGVILLKDSDPSYMKKVFSKPTSDRFILRVPLGNKIKVQGSKKSTFVVLRLLEVQIILMVSLKK